MGVGSARVIQLEASYSCKVNYTGSTTTTFTIPSGYTYVGAGIHSYTPDNSNGGCRGVFNIDFNGVDKLTLTISMGGNWGSSTINGKVVLNVFVV